MKFDHRFTLREAGKSHRVYEADGVRMRLDFFAHMLRVALVREGVPLVPTWSVCPAGGDAPLFGRDNGAYLYYFDLDAPGDDNRAIHSCDLRYMLGTLWNGWRPYGKRDYEASEQLMDYLANFARTGDPNGPALPPWQRGKAALRIAPEGTAMGHISYLKLLRNMLTKGDPKA